MARVIVTVGDAGDADVLTPVLKRLQEIGVGLSVYTHPEGKGKKGLKKAGVPFTEALDVPQEVLLSSSLLLTGSSGKKPELNLAASIQARELGIPVVWVEDFYGPFNHINGTEWHGFVPDYLVVMDDSVVERARARWGDDFGKINVQVLGNPSFDGLAGIVARKEELRENLREICKMQYHEEDRWYSVCHPQHVIVFSASSSTQVDMAETIDSLCGALENKQLTVLIPRFHPADPEKEKWRKYIEKRFESKDYTSNYVISLKDPPPGWSEDEIHAAADLVVVQYSKGGVKAALMDVPTLFMLLPSARAYQDKSGTPYPYFPQIEKGAAVAVSEQEEVYGAVERLLRKPTDHLSSARREHFPLDGNATARVTDFVCWILE